MSKHLEGLLPTTGLEFEHGNAPHGHGKWGLFGLKENGPGISEPHELPDEYFEEVGSREELLEQLKIDEGVKYEVYLDHLGLATCGIGHLILETDEEYKLEVGDEVSEERVIELFKEIAEMPAEMPLIYTAGLDFVSGPKKSKISLLI